MKTNRRQAGRFPAVQGAWLFLLLFFVVSQPVLGDVPAATRDVGLDEHLGSRLPLGAEFTDDTGRHVRLGDYFGHVPVILVLAWYECPMLCSEVQNGVVQCLLDLTEQPGRDFQVVVVSINPADGVTLARAKKDLALKRYGREGASTGWHYLVGSQPSIDSLTKAVGFRYVYDAATRQYAHPSGIMVAMPSGRLSRYFYGIRFSSGDLRQSLQTAANRQIGGPANKLALLCFNYDPTTGKYGLAILKVMRLAGLCTLVGLGVFMARGRTAHG